MMPYSWKGEPEPGDWWKVEIEHDRFKAPGPAVVTVMVEDGDGQALAAVEPDQAREMAVALLRCAVEADRLNAGP